MSRTRGFTLVEVMVALAILGVSLATLLRVQSSSIDKAGRSRDLTVATLLARSKLIDIEQRLFHEGFTSGTEQTSGNFSDDGYADYAWKAQIAEVRLDLTRMLDICNSLSPSGASGGGDLLGGFLGGGNEAGKGGGGDDASFGCEAMLSTITGTLGGFMEQMSSSLRTLTLTVCWGSGKVKPSIRVRTLLSRDDFNLEQQGQQQRAIDSLGGANLPGVTP